MMKSNLIHEVKLRTKYIKPNCYMQFGYWCFVIFLFMSQSLWAQSDEVGYLVPWLKAEGETELHIFLHEKGEKANTQFSTVELYSSVKFFDHQKQIMSPLKSGSFIERTNYFQWFQWNQKTPRDRYSSEFGIVSKMMQPVFHQYHFFTPQGHFNQFLQVNFKTDKLPTLYYQSSLKGVDEISLSYESLYTEEMLIPLIRWMLWNKIQSKEINLLGNLSNPPGSYQVQYAKIQVKDQRFPIKDFEDMDVVLVEVVRGDGRTANFWLSRNGHHRLVKAILHDGAVLSLIDYQRL